MSTSTVDDGGSTKQRPLFAADSIGMLRKGYRVETIEMLQCPFCDGFGAVAGVIRNGYENEPEDDPDRMAYYVHCHACAAQGGWAKSTSGAVRLWNMRHVSQDRLEQCETQLAGCGVAALGYFQEGVHLAKAGDYGWSASYQAVLELRKKYVALENACLEAQLWIGQNDDARNDHSADRVLKIIRDALETED